MNTDRERQTTRFSGKHVEIADLVLLVFYDVDNEPGGGFLESVYRSAFALALRQAGSDVVSQVAVPMHFPGVIIGDFRAGLIVNDAVLLELKALQVLERAHEAQILLFLGATPLEVGLLFNFVPKPKFKRSILDNDQKKIRVHPCESVVDSLRGTER